MEELAMRTKTINTLVFVMLVFLAISMGSCRSGKKVVRNEFGREIQMRCSEKNHRSDAEFIRASQVARSSDLSLSKEKAFLMTQDRLVSLIKSNLRAATRRYANERGIKLDYDFAERMESMMVSSVNYTTTMVAIICEETFVNDNGIYTTAMTLEVSKEGILTSYLDRQNRERHFRLDEDMRDFERIFNEETLRPNQW